MPAYVIGQLDIKNPTAYQAYLDGFMPCFTRHGGELLVTSGNEMVLLQGSWALPRTVVMRFPSVAAARAWYDNPEYKKLAKIRHSSADANLVIV